MSNDDRLPIKRKAMSILGTALAWYAAKVRRAAAEQGAAPLPRTTVGMNRTDSAALAISRWMFPHEPLRVVFQDRPPPSLDSFEHPLSNVPEDATLRAWPKLQETERRLAVAVWAMWRTEPESGEHRVLAEDLVGAFFYSFEAAVQVLKEEMEARRVRFEPWISAHPNNTVSLRGIRTIRMLAVHVEDIRSQSGLSVSVVAGRGGTITRNWHLPPLTPEARRTLRSPKLSEDELDAWKELRADRSAGSVMEQALKDLRQIVFDAQQLV